MVHTIRGTSALPTTPGHSAGSASAPERRPGFPTCSTKINARLYNRRAATRRLTSNGHSMPRKLANLARLTLALMSMVLLAVMVGTVVGAGAFLLRWTGKQFAIPWLASGDREMLKLLSTLLFLLPACILVLPRIKTRATLKAAAKRRRLVAQLRADEQAQWRWSIPARVQLSELPHCAIIVAVFYLLTLLAVIAVLGSFNLISHLRHQPITEPTLATAFKCANFMGIMMLSLLAFFLLLFLLGMRNRILLTPEEIVERRGNMRKTYPYRSMTQCQIESSQRVKTLRCLSFSMTEGDQIRWHRFELDPRMPPNQVVEFLNSKGLDVEIIGSHEPSPKPS
jgi:hypothetical protein